MELPWLYSFTVLADLLHFGRAAAALHMSQSALSVQIRNLEASLEVTLFERNRRSVSLTVAGEMQTILSMVASGMGVSILPQSAAELGIKDVAVRPLVGRWPQSELGLVILRSSADDPRLRKFLTTAVQLQPG